MLMSLSIILENEILLNSKINYSLNICLKSLVKIFLPKDMLDNINRIQRKKPSLSWDFQRELLNAFEKDIEIIEKTLNRNLSHWREVR